MSSARFLDLQYNISKRRYLKKPSRLFSSNNHQNSNLSSQVFQPTTEDMKKVFDKFDRDKDGKISQVEYKAMLKALGKGGTAREVQKIFEVADLDKDGFIDFKDFMEINKKSGGMRTVDIQGAFRIFDLDGDGKITVDEVFQLLNRLGERNSLQECRKMVKAVDTNDDGVIDMDEFMAMMTKSLKIG